MAHTVFAFFSIEATQNVLIIPAHVIERADYGEPTPSLRLTLFAPSEAVR